MGRTKTIRERAVTVYLPTLEMTEEWKKIASAHGVSLSQYVFEVVDDSIRRKAGMQPREELVKQNAELQQEAKRISAKLAQAETILKDNMETIAKYRRKLAEAPARLDYGIAKKVAGLFQDKDVVTLRDIPGSIGVELSDADGMASIVDSVNLLVSCGFIEENMREGRWIAERGRDRSAAGKVRGHH